MNRLHPLRRYVRERGGGIDAALRALTDEINRRIGDDIDPRTLRSWYDSDRRPRPERAVALAAVIGCDPMELMTWPLRAGTGSDAKPIGRRGGVGKARKAG